MVKHMAGVRRAICGAAVGLALLAVAGCSEVIHNHGYAPTDDELAAIEVGRSSRAGVADAIGRPSSTGLMQDSGWFYVKSRYRERYWRGAEEFDREVVAISFDDNDRVSNVERFGLEDGQVIALSRRVTDTNIRGVGFIRQLFRNLGNFTADQFLN
jgi:outer membrane protein assembly factor BamE (lipoprotein component of BamABCDE complex)